MFQEIFETFIKYFNRTKYFRIFQIFPGPETFFKYFLKHLKHLNISNFWPALAGTKVTVFCAPSFRTSGSRSPAQMQATHLIVFNLNARALPTDAIPVGCEVCWRSGRAAHCLPEVLRPCAIHWTVPPLFTPTLSLRITIRVCEVPVDKMYFVI